MSSPSLNYYISSYLSSNQHPLIHFKARLIDLSMVDLQYMWMYCRTTIDKSDFCLHREHLNAVKSLCNNNIILSKLEKLAGVVILDKEYYNIKLLDIFKDTIKF